MQRHLRIRDMYLFASAIVSFKHNSLLLLYPSFNEHKCAGLAERTGYQPSKQKDQST